MPLKPADVAVALQLSLTPDVPYRELAAAVGISHGEAHNAVRRLQAARPPRRPCHGDSDSVSQPGQAPAAEARRVGSDLACHSKFSHAAAAMPRTRMLPEENLNPSRKWRALLLRFGGGREHGAPARDRCARRQLARLQTFRDTDIS